ncbi:MAG: aminopeptidase P family protein [Verrucomicrobiota bacterium]
MKKFPGQANILARRTTNSLEVSNEYLNAKLFTANRERLKSLLPPRSLAVVNANDIPPTNADGSLPMVVNSDLFYLTGVEQEQSLLILNPDAEDAKHREILFLREASPENELWEGHKLTREEARELTGIQTIYWLAEFPRLFHRLMCAAERVYLNTNEHNRAVIEVESRDARFITEVKKNYPLHDYRRLAPLMHQLRVVKSEAEIGLIRQACSVTRSAFERVAKFTRPGVTEYEIEAEYAHEFTRNRCKFAYAPIIATAMNACCLHYTSNASTCQAGELLLLDVAAAYRNYNSDLTRTIPIGGRFTPRQKKIYNAVLRVLRASIANLQPGKTPREWQQEAELLMEKELIGLGLLTMKDIKKQSPESPAVKKYFMHGVGHPLGLSVHDVVPPYLSFQPGWVMTVEPAIYVPEEKLAVRLENNVLITETGTDDLMADIPIEIDDIEALMRKKQANSARVTF